MLRRFPLASIAILLMVGLVGQPLLAAPTPALIKDINRIPAPADSYPRPFAQLGGVTLLLAEEGRSDLKEVEVWRTDGTAAGTFRLSAVCGEGCVFFPQLLAVAGNRAFFTIHPLVDGQSGDQDELWVSNGSPAGTFRIKDGFRLPSNETPSGAWLASRGLLFFVAVDPDHGRELWRSDGTPGGTFRLTNLANGPSSSPGEPTVFNGKLYFSADQDGPSGGALWRSDGTAKGTVMVKDPLPGSTVYSNPEGLRVVGSKLLFLAPAAGQGKQLWCSDGTTKGTAVCSAFTAGTIPFLRGGTVVAGSRLLYFASTPNQGMEVGVADGTLGGTRLLSRFAPSDPFQQDPNRIFRPSADGRSAYFLADDGTHGTELWASDGTVAGTRLVKEGCPGPCSGGVSLGGLLGSRFYFTARDEVRGVEPWSTDGTEAGTRMLADLCPGSCDSNPYFTSSPLGSRLGFITVKDEVTQTWATDGSEAGTVAIALPAPGRAFAFVPFGSVVAGSGLLGVGNDQEHGIELWRSDLTRRGTRLVSDINTNDLGGSHPSRLKRVGSAAYFFADDGLSGFELWKSDGTAQGTLQVVDAAAGPEPAELPDHDRVLGADSQGRVYFLALTDPALSFSGYALWKTDGTAAGTLPLTSPGVVEWCGPDFAELNGRAYFVLSDDAHGCELWSSDGTAAGTKVLDVVPGYSGLDPFGLTVLQGKLYFTGADYHGEELWQSDGTVAGTSLVKDLAPGSDSGMFSEPIPLAGKIYFLGFDGETNTNLWVSDGTAAGTKVAVSMTLPEGYLGYKRLVKAGDRLWISGLFDTGRSLLLASDGTPAGTVRLAEAGLDPGVAPYPFNGRTYFSSGLQLWSSNGTAAGTRPLLDRSGRSVRVPNSFAQVGQRLTFFATASQIVGRTLWQTDGSQSGTGMIPGVSVIDGYEDGGLVGSASRLFFTGTGAGSGVELWGITP